MSPLAAYMHNLASLCVKQRHVCVFLLIFQSGCLFVVQEVDVTERGQREKHTLETASHKFALNSCLRVNTNLHARRELNYI